MANLSWTMVWSNSSTSNLRAAGSAWRTMFETLGFVRAADTGQVDWTTVTQGGSAGELKGYEVWRFDDALQATRPVFFKVYYTNGNAFGSAALRARIEFGTGSNGSGTLTGLGAGTIYNIVDPNQNQNDTDLCYAAGDGSGMAAHLMCGNSNAGASYYRTSLVIDRARNADGTPNGDGVFVWIRGMGASSNNNVTHNSVVYDYVQNRVMGPTVSSFCFPLIPALVSGSEWIDSASAVSFYPLCFATPKIQHVKMMVALNPADLGWSPTSGPTIQHLGAAREYRLLRQTHYGTGLDWGNSGPLSAAFWWSD